MKLYDAKQLKLGDKVAYKWMKRWYETGRFIELVNDNEAKISDVVFQDFRIINLRFVRLYD
jgi:hypothetical protein